MGRRKRLGAWRVLRRFRSDATGFFRCEVQRSRLRGPNVRTDDAPEMLAGKGSLDDRTPTRSRVTQQVSTPFTEAIATLNDRALRRLLGARAFLRGYDYVRRHAVENVQIERPRPPDRSAGRIRPRTA